MVSVISLNVVFGVAVVLANVYAAITSESTNNLVVPESPLVNSNKAVAVTVFLGIADTLVTIAPLDPAVANKTVFVGVDVVSTVALMVSAVEIRIVCPNAAVNVLAIIGL